MKRLQIFIISILLTVSFGLFNSTSGKTSATTAPLFTAMGIGNKLSLKARCQNN